MVHLHTHTSGSYRPLKSGLLLLVGWLWSIVAVAQNCTPTGGVTILGVAGQTTTISGGNSYNGIYRVVGNLVFTNGTYTLNPGTVFYVDGQATRTGNGVTIEYRRRVLGNTITVGADASLELNNATITASGSTTNCPMWRGIVLDNGGQGPSSATTRYRLMVQNKSTISHALCGIELNDVSVNGGQYTGVGAYLIDNSTLAHNLTHIRDVSRHPQGLPSLITNCTFDSEPAQMHYPYEQLASGDSYYAYQALYLSPRGDYASHAIEVSGNTISNAVYGIVNTYLDRAGVLIQGNTLSKIFITAIWTVNNDSYSGTRTPVTSGNMIGMNGLVSPNIDQVAPNATRYGIIGEGIQMQHYNAFVGNTVTGNLGQSYKQIGLSIYGQTDASGNLLQNVDEGISATELDGSAIFDNRTAGCASGFVVKSYSNGISQVNQLGCNTFSQGTTRGNTTGIVVEQDATINDIGSFSSPAANQFDNLTDGIRNDNAGASFAYYQTNSPQEMPTVTGPGSVMLNTVRIRNLSNYCFNQGAVNYNGVNRVAGPSAGYLAALMDSVRRQLVPPARSRSYLCEVVSYHASTQQLAALEAWWATLAVPNAAAYRTVGRYLLSAYDTQQATAAAQRILTGLQPQALLNAELAAQLQLRLVLRHLSQTAPTLTATDSVRLRLLAWSGTSVAEAATRWLRYFHPRIPVPTPVPVLTTTPRLAAVRKAVLTESGALLGVAYPNPAQTEVTISCQLAQADQVAELRFTNLLTGRVALVVPVEGVGTERGQRVSLANLPAGQYAYQLVVQGQPVVAPQRLTVKP